MKVDKPLRVLHCPWNVGGIPGSLALAERKLGLMSHSVELATSGPYRFQVDETLFPLGLPLLTQEQFRWRLLWRAIREYDVIHFHFGESILMGRIYPGLSPAGAGRWRDWLFERYWSFFWMADLPLLKRLGKGIVMTYYGDDARQGDESRRRFPITFANFVDTHYYTPLTDAWKRRAIAKVARYADRIYALNPDLLHVLPPTARFLPYANVDLKEWTVWPRTGNLMPVVVHAPTDRKVKGTQFILEAVERLRREAVPFEFVLVEKMARQEARRAYERADLLVDQLLLGWYGGVATECMALQKPVISYLRAEDFAYVPPGMIEELPVVNANPNTIYATLKALLTTRRAELPELGRRGRAYVEKWHDPVRIATIVSQDYRDIIGRRRHPAGVSRAPLPDGGAGAAEGPLASGPLSHEATGRRS